MTKRVKSRTKGIRRTRAAHVSESEWNRLVVLCAQRSFLEAVMQELADRRDSLGRVMQREGPDGLVAIADEVAAQLDGCTPTEKALGVVAAHCGFLMGVAAGRAECVLAGASQHSAVH